MKIVVRETIVFITYPVHHLLIMMVEVVTIMNQFLHLAYINQCQHKCPAALLVVSIYITFFSDRPLFCKPDSSVNFLIHTSYGGVYESPRSSSIQWYTNHKNRGYRQMSTSYAHYDESRVRGGNFFCNGR